MALLRPTAGNPLRVASQWWFIPGLVLLAGIVAMGWLGIVKTAGRENLLVTAQLRAKQANELTTTLTRSGMVDDGVEAEVILATSTFFQLSGRTAEGVKLGADRAMVFVANESVHYGELPKQFAPILRVDDKTTYVPSSAEVLVDAVHHRTTVLVFNDIPADFVESTHQFSMLLPRVGRTEPTTLYWSSPIEYPANLAQPGSFTIPILISMAAGLLAAISPCLLQLTAYYLPTLAGVSVDALAGGAAPAVAQRKVMKTAVLFVLGFTIPYTIGGALMGALGQQIAASGLLSPTSPITIGAGAVMILAALTVAYRAKAPLVCHVPMPSMIKQSSKLPFVTVFVAGFAMATGCLTCFGGAILGVLLVYAGLLGSAPLGGLAMFLFSLGIAIPFLLAAASMSKVMPLVAHIQRLTPAIGFATSAIMLFFGVVMITGQFHVVSGWLIQNLPLS